MKASEIQFKYSATYESLDIICDAKFNDVSICQRGDTLEIHGHQAQVPDGAALQAVLRPVDHRPRARRGYARERVLVGRSGRGEEVPGDGDRHDPHERLPADR